MRNTNNEQHTHARTSPNALDMVERRGTQAAEPGYELQQWLSAVLLPVWKGLGLNAPQSVLEGTGWELGSMLPGY